MSGKINDKLSSLETHNSVLKTNLEEMRLHIGQLKQELEQEQNAVKQLRREKVLEIKQIKEQEEQNYKMIISDLKSKFVHEKQRELLNLKELLSKQHNAEINRISHTKDEALKKFQLGAQKEKEEYFARKKHELLAEAKEDAARAFATDKMKLLQEVDDLRRSKKRLEEELNLSVNADRLKATDLRRSYEEHLRELDHIRKEANTDIRRLIDELKSKDRVIGDLEKELGYQSSYSQRLLLEKDSLGSLLNLTKMAESWEKRSPRAAMKKSQSLDLASLTDHEDTDKERRLQLRLSELNNTVRRLEDRNRQLTEEKKMLNTSECHDSSPEKIKQHSKRLKDAEQLNKRLEEKSRLLEMENKRLRTLKDQMRCRLERENKNLKKALNEEHANSAKEELSEVQKLKTKLDKQAKIIDELKNDSVGGLSVDKKTAMKGISDDVSQASTIPSDDEDDWNEFDKAELEANYQQLSKEFLQLQKAYSQLQTVVGGTLDPQREARMRKDLESDLIESQTTIERLQKLVADSGTNMDWLKEKKLMQHELTKSNEKLNELEYSLKEVKDEKELLEFQLLETSEQDISLDSDPPTASTPRIMVTHHVNTDGAGLQHACTLEDFDEILYSELKQRLEALNTNKDFILSKADSELLNQTIKMLNIADRRLKTMDEEITLLKNNISVVENEKDKLATDNLNMSAELASQTLEGQSAQKKVDELEEAVEQLKNTESKLELVEGAFKRNEERLEQENKKLKKQLSDANEGRTSENEMLQQKVNDNTQLTNRVTELERELALRERHLNKTERQRLIAMEKEVGQHKKTIKHLQDFLMEHETKGAEIQEEKTLLEEENKELVQESSHLKMKTVQLRTELSKLQEQLEDIEAAKNFLEETIHANALQHSNKVTDLECKIANMDEQMQKLIEENDKLSCKIKYFEDNGVTIDKYKELLNESEKLRNIETDLRIQIQTLEEKLNKYEIKVEDSTDEDTSCSLSLPIDNSHFNNEKGDNEKSEKELKERLDEFETSEKELKEEIKKLKSSDDTLKMTLSQLISENSTFLHEKTKAQSEADGLKEEEVILKKVIKDQMAENGKLHQQISDLQTTVTELQQSYNPVSNQVDENEILLKDIEVLEDIKLQLENKVKLLEEEKDDLEVKLHNFEQLVRDARITNTEELETSNELLKQKFEELQIEHKKLLTEVKEIKDNENKLQAKLDEMQDSEQALFEKISSITHELDESKEQIDSLDEIRRDLKEKLGTAEEQLEELKMSSLAFGKDSLGSTTKSLQDDLGGSFNDSAKNNTIDNLELQVSELTEENERLQTELTAKQIVEDDIQCEESLIDFSTPPPLPESPPPLPVSQPQALPNLQLPLHASSLPILEPSKDEAAIWQELEGMEIPGNIKNNIKTDQIFELKENLKIKENQCQDLLEKLQNLELQIEKCNKDLGSREKELTENAEILLEKTKDIEELEKAIGQSEKRCSESEIQRHDLEEELKQSHNEVEDFKVSILELEENEEVLVTKIKELEKQFSDLKDQNFTLESAEKDLKMAMKDVEEENASLIKRIDNVKKVEEQLNEKIKEAETNLNRVNMLSQEKEETDRMLLNVNKIKEENEQKLQILELEMNEEREILNARIENLQLKENKLLGKIDLLENVGKDKEKDEDNIESLTFELHQVKEELFKVNGNIQEKDKMLEKSDQYCKQLEDRVAELEKHESEFMEKSEKCFELQTECDNLKIHVERLEQSENKLKEIVQSVTNDEQQIKEKIKSLENEVLEKEKCLQLLKEDNDKLSLQCSSISDVDSRRIKSVSESNTQIGNSNLLHEAVEVVVDNLQQVSYHESEATNCDSQCIISSLEDKIRELEDEKQEMEQRIFELEQKETAFQETLSQADAIMSERESGLLEQINELESSQNDLKERLEAARSNSEDRASDDWHDALDGGEEIMESCKDEKIKHLEQRVSELEDEEFQLKLELKNTDESSQNNDKFASCLKRISDLKDIEAKLLMDLEQAENTHKSLSNANEELLEEVAVLRMTVEDLESHRQDNEFSGTNIEEEFENVLMQLKDAQETEEKLKGEISDKENLVKELRKSNLQLEDDVETYCVHVKNLEDSEKKLKELLNEHSKSGDILKGNLNEFEEKINELEANELFLTEKLSEKEETENTLKKKLLAAEECFKQSEKSLKESQELLKKQMHEMEAVDNELRNHVSVMEDSEADLKKKILKLELVTVNAVQQIEQLERSNEELKSKSLASEEAEKLLRIDFNQIKHEKDILNEKATTTKKSDKMLRERIEELESTESQLRTQVWKLERGEVKLKDRIQELEQNISSMERKSNQAIELEQEMLRLQSELQETSMKQEQLERSKHELQDKYNKLHNSLNQGNMELGEAKVSVPEEEYHQMKAQVTLLSFDVQEQPKVENVGDLIHKLSHQHSCKFINDFVLQNTPTTGHKSLKDALESISQDCYPTHLTDASIDQFYILYRLQALEEMFEDLELPLNATRLHNMPGHSHIIFDENDEPVEIHCALCARKKMEEKKRAAEQWLATVARETHPTNLIQREIVSKDSYSSFEEATPLQQASPNTRRKLIDDLVNALPMITVEESENDDQSDDNGSMILEESLSEIRIDDNLESPPITMEAPPLPGTAPPTHKRVPSISSEMSDNPPPLPKSPPPSNGSLKRMKAHDESDGNIQRPKSLFARPLSFDSGTETLSTTTVDHETDQPPAVGRGLSLPATPRVKRETPELGPKPPTPLWLKKMMEWQSQEKEKEISEAQRMKTQNTILQTKIDEKDNLIQEIRKREEDLKRKLRDMEHISISRQKIQAKELELEEKNFEIASLKSENWQKEREIATLQSKIKELKRLEGNHSNEDGILKKLRDELDQTKRNLHLKQNQLQDIGYNDNNLQDQVQRSNQQLKEKDEELQKNAKELCKLRKKLHDLENEVDDAHSSDAEVKQLQQMLDAVHREKVQLQSQIAKVPEMEQRIEALKEEQRNMDLALREKDSIDRKLQLAENMLKEKTGEEMFLADENASLQEKVTHLEKLNKYKDNIEEHYQDIKDKFDIMEQQKNEAELAICPLKAKVSYLREKCKERDLLIKKMSRVLQAHVDSNVTGQLLSEITELQTSMPSEEYNQPLPLSSQLKKSSKKDYLPKSSSTSILSPLGQHSRKNLSSDALDRRPKTPRSRSPVFGGQPSQSLNNGLDELDMTEGISVTELLKKTSKPQKPFTSKSDSMEDLLDSLQTLSETIRGNSASHSKEVEMSTSSQLQGPDWLNSLSPTTIELLSRTRNRRSKPASVYMNSSPERIVQMHQELQDSHTSQYEVPYQSSVNSIMPSATSSKMPVHNGVTSISKNHLLPGHNIHENGLLIPDSTLNNTTYSNIPQNSTSRLPTNNTGAMITPNSVLLPNGVPVSNGAPVNRVPLSTGVQPNHFYLGHSNTIGVANDLTIPGFPNEASPTRTLQQVQPKNVQLNHTNVTKHPVLHSGIDIPDLPGTRKAVSSNGYIRPESKQVKGEPPEPPSQFSVAKQFGKHGVLLTWIPPVMDGSLRSNHSQVVGYKLFVNRQQRQFVADANLKKALVDGVDLHSPVTFGIQTMSNTGLHSRIVETSYNHILAVPYTSHSESAVTDSVHEMTTEDSSIVSDDQEQRLFIAVYEYIPEKHSPNDYPAYELAFEEGDILTIYGQKRQDGFYQGKVRGKYGLVPSNFIEEIAMSGKRHSKRKHNNQTKPGEHQTSIRESRKLLPVPRSKKTGAVKHQQGSARTSYKQR